MFCLWCVCRWMFRPQRVGAYALEMAFEGFGLEFAPEKVFVIGDTPRDVECGQQVRACTIAVATGKYSVTELEAAGPDFVFKDLSDTSAFPVRARHWQAVQSWRLIVPSLILFRYLSSSTRTLGIRTYSPITFGKHMAKIMASEKPMTLPNDIAASTTMKKQKMNLYMRREAWLRPNK